MALIIPNTTIGDAYTHFDYQGDLVDGSFSVANNPVDVVITVGLEGQIHELPVFYQPPATGIPLLGLKDQPIRGIAFKNHVAGQTPSPQVWGSLFTAVEPRVGGGQAFAGTVSSSGSVTPPPLPSSGVITGVVAANGAIVAGSGFSVVHAGTGIYDVTFANGLATAPVVNADGLENISGGGLFPTVAQPCLVTANGFRVSTFVTGTGLGDKPWNFLVTPVQ